MSPRSAGVLACVLVCAFLLAQSAPFKPGRARSTLDRLHPERLEAVRQARARFASARRPNALDGLYQDFRAVLHVHAQDSTHTKGTRDEVLKAAQSLGIQIVGFTDHAGPKPDTWRGLRDGVLFLAGAEDSAGFLRFPESGIPLTFLAHVEERYDAPVAGLAGLEIFNRHSDAKDEPEFSKWFEALEKDPPARKRFAALVRAYPDEVFAAQHDHWPDIFAKWDREIGKARLTGIAGNDAHHNQVYGDIDFDPYEVSFRHAVTHVLARELDERQIRESLRDGHVYVAHEYLADPTGFSFQAGNNLGVVDMGDSLYLAGPARLAVRAPLEAKLKLIRDGSLVEERTASALDISVNQPGAYRVEAWLPVDGEDRPWIYSNPIYLKAPDLTRLRLPSHDLAPTVEAKRDLVYTNGAPEDDAKHKLDLYLPKGKRDFPVIFFVHGGSWRFGDRSQYPPLGNRFARAGIGVAAISYRLAPGHRHPAQIDDVAAAFRWVYDHIQEYGGRRDRIFAAGHSAGAHLVSLLALDPRHLAKHSLDPSHIRGVIAMSGVYEVGAFPNVFGDEAEVRRQASPLTHVHNGAPPFLVTYCQWDYRLLPAQARKFHAALSSAGTHSELVFVAGEGHISEMVSLATKDEDLTARSVLKFVQ